MNVMNNPTPEFEAFYLGQWPEINLAVALAEEHHERVEAFDRRVCTGPIVDGAVLPANDRERILINTNAWSVRAQIMARALNQGISKAQMQKAIVNYRR